MDLTNRKKIMISAGVALSFIIIIILAINVDDSNLPPLEPTNHKSVALHFVNKNGTISKRMGEITQSSQIGDGGGGKKSHNVWRLVGDDDGVRTTGVCDITLEKNKKGEYEVTKAILSMKGTEYNISTKGFSARKGKSMSVR
ncbi:hypothetical protein ACFL47_08965 [Candidatus Latescibacterota bacterium]